MADLAVEGDRHKSSWLQYSLGQPQVFSKNRRSQPTLRNLSSACKGNVRNFPANPNHVQPLLMRTMSNEEFTTSSGSAGLKGIYNSSKLQELPPGYFANGDLWLASKDKTIRKDTKSQSAFSQDKYRVPHMSQSAFTSMARCSLPGRLPTAMQSQLRSKSAKQRTLGTTRSDMRRCTSSESRILDVQAEWQMLDYSRAANPFNIRVNNFQDNNRTQPFHYYGQTRINLDDPAGLFYQFDYKSMGSPSGRKPVNKNASEPKSALQHTENMVLVRNSKRSGNLQKRENSFEYIKPNFRQTQYPSSLPENSSLIAKFKNSLVSKKNIYDETTGEVGDSLTSSHTSLDIPPLTDSATNIGQENKPLSANHGSSSRQHCTVTLPKMIDSYSDGMHKQNDDSLSVKNNLADTLETLGVQLTKDNGDSNSSFQVHTPNKKQYIVDEAQHLCETFVSKRDKSKETQKENMQNLSFSKFFLISVENSRVKKDRMVHGRPEQRSVRFKVHDTVHEYEPWAPVQITC